LDAGQKHTQKKTVTDSSSRNSTTLGPSTKNDIAVAAARSQGRSDAFLTQLHRSLNTASVLFGSLLTAFPNDLSSSVSTEAEENASFPNRPGGKAPVIKNLWRRVSLDRHYVASLERMCVAELTLELQDALRPLDRAMRELEDAAIGLTDLLQEAYQTASVPEGVLPPLPIETTTNECKHSQNAITAALVDEEDEDEDDEEEEEEEEEDVREDILDMLLFAGGETKSTTQESPKNNSSASSIGGDLKANGHNNDERPGERWARAVCKAQRREWAKVYRDSEQHTSRRRRQRR
jgi:hypothetical protein